MSPALDGNGLMKKRCCSALQCCVPYSPVPGTLGGIFYACCVSPAIVSWQLFPSVQSSTEAVFACYGQCLVPGWGGVCSLNKGLARLLVKLELLLQPGLGLWGLGMSFNMVHLSLLRDLLPPMPPLDQGPTKCRGGET